MDEYDDPDDPEAEDQKIFSHSGWSAMHRLHQRFENNPQSLAFPSLGDSIETGRHRFRIRFGDLNDALVALTLKRKPLPLQVELLLNRLRVSVASEHGLVAQVDAPLISGSFADPVCIEGVQDIMVRLPRLRRTVPPGAELDCEIDLDREHFLLRVPHSLEERLVSPQRRGRIRYTNLRLGIRVPPKREARPWEGLSLEGAGESLQLFDDCSGACRRSASR